MKAVIQRVSSASVQCEGQITGEIENGFLVLLGVFSGDTKADADKLAAKIPYLRIFKDDGGKMNLSLLDTGGSVLLVSQFTLCADCSHGRRPSFINSAPAADADELYQYLAAKLRSSGLNVQTGVFGGDMKVQLLNDGPVTIILDSQELK